MSKFSIRHLDENDWEAYSVVRLESLVKHPAYFCPSRDESKFTESDWRERLRNKNSASFGLFADDKMIGITGVVKDQLVDDAEIAFLVTSYIKEPYRRLGLSKLFFESRIQWAKKQKNIKALVLEHRDDNLPSQKAHQLFGFRFVDSKIEKWPDGKVRPSLKYQLDL